MYMYVKNNVGYYCRGRVCMSLAIVFIYDFELVLTIFCLFRFIFAEIFMGKHALLTKLVV